jgi:WD40 repeat protein
MFSFTECTEWISNIEYDSKFQRVYAISELSIYILDIKSRSCVACLSHAHESPVTKCCWYDADQFYITGCAKGTIRCWSPNNKLISGVRFEPHSNGEDGLPLHSSHTNNQFTLLHTFLAHASAITGLVLHPSVNSSNMCISSGMDGYVKIFSLESYEILQQFNTSFSINKFILFEHNLKYICLICHTNGDIHKWKLEPYSKLFKNGHEPIEYIELCDNYGITRKVNHIEVNTPISEDVNHDNVFDAINQMLDVPVFQAQPPQQPQRSNSKDMFHINRQFSRSVSLNESSVDSADDSTVSFHQAPFASRPPTVKFAADVLSNDRNAPPTTGSRNIALPKCILVGTGHDINLVGIQSNIICRIEPEQLIDEVLFCAYSVYQQLLFCCVSSGCLKIFCMRSSIGVAIRSIVVSTIGSDLPSCMTIIPDMCVPVLRSAQNSKDMRGNVSPMNAMEALAIGTVAGTLYFLDTYHDCALISSHHCYQGKIHAVKYRDSRNELLTIGASDLLGVLSIKIMKIPSVAVTNEILCDKYYSCWNYSSKFSYIAYGSKNGICRYFTAMESDTSSKIGGIHSFVSTRKDNSNVSDGSYAELLRQDENHSNEILCISFCDELKIYATSSLDMSIKIWNYDRHYLRTLIFDIIPNIILFHNKDGDLLIAQNKSIIKISINVWNISQSETERKDDAVEDNSIALLPSSPKKTSASSRHTTSRSSTSRRTGTRGSVKTPASDVFLTESNLHDDETINGFVNVPFNMSKTKRGYWSSSEFDGVDDQSRETKVKSDVVFDVRHPKFTIRANNRKQRPFVPSLSAKKKIVDDKDRDEHEESVNVLDTQRKTSICGRKASAVMKMKSLRQAFIHNSNNEPLIQMQSESDERRNSVVNFVDMNHSGTTMIANLNARSTALASIQQKVIAEEHFDEEYFIKVNGPMQTVVQKRGQRHRNAIMRG